MTQRDVILCIDDEPIILQLIRKQLEKKFGDRFDYLFAEDADEADAMIQQLEKEGKQLVMAIVDQILPGRQGHEFLIGLGDTHPKAIKILFSAKADFTSVVSAINEAQIFRYLIKPWDETDFTNIVEKGLQQYYIKENIELQLAEIHHRVKNNLTIISCLLELQITELEHEESKEYFAQSINRINSIAKVHELIYDSDDMSSVDIKQYLDRVIPAIRDTMEDFSKNIKMKFSIPSLKLRVNQAIPLGLLFNELLTNTFKYAFKGRDEGCICISMKLEAHKLRVIYKDNGVGFENKITSFESSGNLGLTLIHLQLQQLESDYTIDTDGQFRLEFSFDVLKEQKEENHVFQAL